MKKQYCSILLFTFMFNSAHGFTLGSSTNSSMEGWSNPEVSFAINTANCPSNVDLNGVVDDAIKIWNNVPNSKLKLSRGGTTTGTAQANPPVIRCSTSFATDSGGMDPSFVAGVGTFSLSGNAISQGLIVLNAQVGTGAYIGNMNSMSLKVILAHEMGHVLGLGHSDQSSALMYYAPATKSDFTLNQDDMDGIAYLYPRNETGSDKMMGCGTVAGGSNFPPGAGRTPVVVLFMLLPLFAWAILRRRANSNDLVIVRPSLRQI